MSIKSRLKALEKHKPDSRWCQCGGVKIDVIRWADGTSVLDPCPGPGQVVATDGAMQCTEYRREDACPKCGRPYQVIDLVWEDPAPLAAGIGGQS